ncbi:uncharacterized protein G2W53_040797 [Senna tora]|uniref:Uncharacterized protein n=1 Tax=Senna tora TaxID=362788 RepID=A0A834SEP2_9FABA|nr:uncharacterized protein G2W53_040797 [Senna tora]
MEEERVWGPYVRMNEEHKRKEGHMREGAMSMSPIGHWQLGLAEKSHAKTLLP